MLFRSMLRAKQADILFMNMQYSPRTESVIAAGSYEEAMRFVALQYEVLLFDRFAIMRHWSEMGTFHLFATTKKTDPTEHVHASLASLRLPARDDGRRMAQRYYNPVTLGSGPTSPFQICSLTWPKCERRKDFSHPCGARGRFCSRISVRAYHPIPLTWTRCR